MRGADFEFFGQMFDVEAVLTTMANLFKAVAVPESGHLPQEERSDLVNA